MIPQNLNFLKTHSDYDFYVKEEIGISNKLFANENNLYEDFSLQDEYLESTFQAIFTQDYWAEKKISQIWIFKESEPIGLCLAIHKENPNKLKDVAYNLTAYNVGYIQLFIKKEHRKKGLASESVYLLESMLIKDVGYPNCVVMQDDAFLLGKCLQKSCAIPFPENENYDYENNKVLSQYIKKMITNDVALIESKIKYPKFYKEYKLLETKNEKNQVNKRKLISNY